ncbi:MAG: hypothetical protein A2Y12_19740 [Planctomycetes bacterium GWF2_42_9]|nr:MAG: hypothetical protein A2Y12_19740 [Planctomycetes bacterium GWF2_42_9]
MNNRKENGVWGMTTDAKIGLLLGLVFIVIIAFVINGLPSFKKDNPNDLTEKYINQVNNQPVGLTDAPRQALDRINSNTPTYVALAPEANTVGVNTGIVQANAPIAVNADNNTNPAQAQATVDTAIVAEDNAVAVVPGAQIQIPVATADTLPDGAIATYEVKKGDTIGSIAAKFYGADGKKKANIERLVKANSLKSAAKIGIGDKLVIPAPEKGLEQVEPSLFEKVENMGKRALGIDNNNIKQTQIASVEPAPVKTPASSSQYREYTIAPGDNPWKIAAKQMGNGNRNKEIFKLNPHLRPDNLKVGTKIKLPQR